MKKCIWVLGVLCIMISVSSCGFFNDGKANDDLEVDEKQKIITDAIVNQDEELFKSVLSKSALYSSDLDEGIRYCFELIDGAVIGVEKKGCPVLDYFDSGKHTKKIEATYLLTTDSDKVYNLYFELWTVQEVEPQKLGVDKVKLCDYNDAINDPDYVKAGEYTNSGIYNPEWDESYMDSTIK